MQMIDVLQKLKEIASRSPEEIGRAIAAAEKMSGRSTVSEEMSEKQKKYFGGGKKDDDKDNDKADAKGSKPDFLDLDKDNDTDEPMSKAAKDKKKHVKEDDNLDKVNAIAGDLKAMSNPPKMPHVNDIPSDSPAAMFKTEAVKEPGAVATAQVMKMGGDYVTDDGKHLTKKGIAKRDEIIKAIESKKDESVNEDVQITLTGSDAVLAEILKLAGQIGAKTAKGPEPVAAAGPPAPLGLPSTGPLPSLDKMMGPDIMDEPMMDDFSASTTPDETVMDLDAAIPAGNDLNKPKLTAPRVSPGDNPMQPPISFR